MKILKIFIRITLLLVMILLGFAVVFPEWADFKDILISEYQEKTEAPVSDVPKVYPESR